MSGIESLLIGRELGGRYRIEEVIGRGGMGAVYRALDERLGRQVAIKVITANTGDPEARERLRARFFREARSAALLPHDPNVVPVYDYGSDEALGLDYLVMELLRGSDLATRLSRSGAPPLPASLKILVEAARGVAVGHRQGLIHRDVKPGNIFLAQTHNNEVQVRVVDFGIAKLADDEDTLAQLTQDGRVPHSPAYASPEQLRGLTNLTTASDVFSLGALGFQLLTGERPFTESDRNKLSLGMPVEVPSVRQRNPAVPAAVDEVIRRALAFDPAQRFPDAGSMAIELEKAVRTMADTPLDPYLGGAPIVTAAALGEPLHHIGGDDDRTRLVDDEDDRTLLAPPPAPPSAAAPLPRREPPVQRPREPLPPRLQQPATRRGIGGMLVWALVIIVLTGAVLWAWSSMQQTSDLSQRFPPVPDTLDIVIPEVPPEDLPLPEEFNATQNFNAGVRFYQVANYDSAAVYLGRAVAMEPGQFQFRRSYGLALYELGDAEGAQRELLAALQIDPSQTTTYESLFNAHMLAADTAGAMRALEDFLQRETNPARRQSAESRLAVLRAATEPPPEVPDLLGEPVDPGPVPATP